MTNPVCVDEREAARVMGLAVQTLRNWRFTGRGPQYVKLGRAVRYRMDDILEFINKNMVNLSGNQDGESQR